MLFDEAKRTIKRFKKSEMVPKESLQGLNRKQSKQKLNECWHSLTEEERNDFRANNKEFRETLQRMRNESILGLDNDANDSGTGGPGPIKGNSAVGGSRTPGAKKNKQEKTEKGSKNKAGKGINRHGLWRSNSILMRLGVVNPNGTKRSLANDLSYEKFYDKPGDDLCSDSSVSLDESYKDLGKLFYFKSFKNQLLYGKETSEKFLMHRQLSKKYERYDLKAYFNMVRDERIMVYDNIRTKVEHEILLKDPYISASDAKIVSSAVLSLIDVGDVAYFYEYEFCLFNSI